MDWRSWLGRRPTVADLAERLIRAAHETGQTGWRYDSSDSSLRDGGRVVNLVNLFAEYAEAPRAERPSLLQKYQMLLVPTEQLEVPRLWSLAQRRIYPLLRSRYERGMGEIKQRGSDKPFPTRAALPFLGHLEVIVGYDHGQTISQVQASSVDEWGQSMADVVARALDNLRALPLPHWVAAGESLWKLESAEGYQESFLNLPRTFASLPAKGTPLAMIPNRGVLLASGTDEPGGLTALLTAARHSIQRAPWPLSGELYRCTPKGIECHAAAGADAARLATLKRIDLAGFYDAQRTLLQAHFAADNDDVFVASYAISARRESPDDSHSWCTWTEGVRALLPVTDFIALLRSPLGVHKSLTVSWADAERVAGRHFIRTAEEPPRIRVDTFPSLAELAELAKCAR